MKISVIIVIIICVVFSCKYDETDQLIPYNVEVVNGTNHGLRLYSYSSSGKELKLFYEDTFSIDGVKSYKTFLGLSPTRFAYPFGSDSIAIIFDDKKILSLTCDSFEVNFRTFGCQWSKSPLNRNRLQVPVPNKASTYIFTLSDSLYILAR
jgi:hypothetical protein